MSEALPMLIETIIDDLTIAIYCDENHSLSDELERNEHEIAEAKDIMMRFFQELKSRNLINLKDRTEVSKEEFLKD